MIEGLDHELRALGDELDKEPLPLADLDLDVLAAPLGSLRQPGGRDRGRSAYHRTEERRQRSEDGGIHVPLPSFAARSRAAPGEAEGSQLSWRSGSAPRATPGNWDASVVPSALVGGRSPSPPGVTRIGCKQRSPSLLARLLTGRSTSGGTLTCDAAKTCAHADPPRAGRPGQLRRPGGLGRRVARRGERLPRRGERSAGRQGFRARRCAFAPRRARVRRCERPSDRPHRLAGRDDAVPGRRARHPARGGAGPGGWRPRRRRALELEPGRIARFGRKPLARPLGRHPHPDGACPGLRGTRRARLGGRPGDGRGPRAPRRGRHRELQLRGRRGDGGRARSTLRQRRHAGRQRLPQRHPRGVPELLRAELGSPQGAHARRRRGTTSTARTAPRALCVFRRGGRRPRARAGTATTSAAGTSSC